MTETLPSNATSLNTRYPRVRIVGNEKKCGMRNISIKEFFVKFYNLQLISSQFIHNCTCFTTFPYCPLLAVGSLEHTVRVSHIGKFFIYQVKKLINTNTKTFLNIFSSCYFRYLGEGYRQSSGARRTDISRSVQPETSTDLSYSYCC